MTSDAPTRCPNAFGSRAGARWAALRQRDPSGALLWVYRCRACGLWHLGTEGDARSNGHGIAYPTFAQRRRRRSHA